MRRVILFFVLLIQISCFGQSAEWKTTGMPFYGRQVRCLYEDTVNNVLYAAGQIMSTPSSFTSIRICKYDGTNWTNLGIFNDQVLSVVTYNGDLIAAGYFSAINGSPIFSIARYDGTAWYPMGNFDMEVMRLRVLNSDLYAMGYFNSVNGIPIRKIAKWDGTTWSDVNGFSCDTFGVARDVVFFQGDTYVCGNFNMASGVDHIAVYKGGSWQGVGGGIPGGWTDLTKMLIYQNQLHLMGCIIKPDGNVGNGIQKWDGNVWTEVGAGILDDFNSYSSAGTMIYDAVLHDTSLYVAGCFGNAGFVPAYSVAKWNGLKWCGLTTNGLLSNKAISLGFLNDTLFLGIGDDTLNGVFTNGIIKYVAGNYTDTCSIDFTGINENTFDDSFFVYPNPAQEYVTIDVGIGLRAEAVEIKNILGQTVYSSSETLSPGKQKLEIDVGTLAPGVYIIQLSGGRDVRAARFIKQ
jgi:hypothetical protein